MVTFSIELKDVLKLVKKKKQKTRKGSSDSDGKILTAILKQFAVPFKKKKKICLIT